MSVAISAQGLSKRYRIGAAASAGRGAGRIRWPVFSPFRYLTASLRQPSSAEALWALHDVSFEVNYGESLGIVGHNGAGKSTLLKVLSRITEPTKGRAIMHGRVRSLLEVGTGFHPELTGRENIYLNGAIMGMKRAEIDAKFDEIIAFAETEKFLDTPVKRYSSGMYVRLAFAVAAHLEPEILLVDEVLAVGDASFQKKCLGKIDDVAKHGRTILFVSHNMTAMQNLCQRAIWLKHGGLVADGDAKSVVASYLKDTAGSVTERTWDDAKTIPGNERVRLRRARLLQDGSTPDDMEHGLVTIHTPLRLEFDYDNLVPGASLNVSLHMNTLDGACIFNSVSDSVTCPVGRVRSVCLIPPDLLNDGAHRVSIMIVQDRSTVLYRHDDALVFDVAEGERDGAWFGKWAGVIRPRLEWRTEHDGAEHVRAEQGVREQS